MVNQITPYGNLTYRDLGAANPNDPAMKDRFEATVTLSPEQQAQLDSENRIQQSLYNIGEGQLGRIGQTLGTPFDTSKLPAMPFADEATRQAYRDALMARQEPLFQQDEERLRTRLAAQGGTQAGNENWNAEMDSFNRSRNDARLAAELAAGQEMANMFNLQGSARDRAFQEASYERNLPLAELNQLLGTAGGPQNPTFTPTPQAGVNAADVTGATALAYQGQLANYQAKMNQQNALMGGLAGLGGAALGGWLGGPVGASAGSSAMRSFF